MLESTFIPSSLSVVIFPPSTPFRKTPLIPDLSFLDEDFSFEHSNLDLLYASRNHKMIFTTPSFFEGAFQLVPEKVALICNDGIRGLAAATDRTNFEVSVIFGPRIFDVSKCIELKDRFEDLGFTVEVDDAIDKYFFLGGEKWIFFNFDLNLYHEVESCGPSTVLTLPEFQDGPKFQFVAAFENGVRYRDVELDKSYIEIYDLIVRNEPGRCREILRLLVDNTDSAWYSMIDSIQVDEKARPVDPESKRLVEHVGSIKLTLNFRALREFETTFDGKSHSCSIRLRNFSSK
ncbi:MAG: hypothetical protein WCO09_03855 [bacterium]